MCSIAAVGLAVATLSAQPPVVQWQPQTSGVTVRLRGVSAVSPTVGWASGAAGTVLRTTDGGTTWQRLTVPGAEALDFRDIDATDAHTAHVLSIGTGAASRIYQTSDAGATWTERFANTDPQAFFDAMTFADADHGVAVSDSVDGRFVILLTGNGGRTWTPVPAASLPPALPGEGAFAASGTNVAMSGPQHLWFGTTKSRVVRSTDGGRTWTVHQTPIATGEATGIFSVAFRDTRHGVVVGGNYSQERATGANAAVHLGRRRHVDARAGAWRGRLPVGGGVAAVGARVAHRGSCRLGPGRRSRGHVDAGRRRRLRRGEHARGIGHRLGHRVGRPHRARERHRRGRANPAVE